MQDWIIQLLGEYGYIGVLFLIALENIFPPIPSEVILTFGGFMTTHTNMTVWGVILCSTIGSVLGAVILYGIGRCLGIERLEKWIDSRLGRILCLKKEDIAKANQWFSKKGKLSVLFCRCVPIVRSLISIPAGMAHMNMGLFLLLTTIGSSIWNTVLVCLGVLAGASWEKILGYMDTYSHFVVLIIGGLVGVFLIVFYKKRLSTKAKH